MSSDRERERDDDEPFALGGTFTSELASLAGGEHARLGVEADRTRRFRFKVEAWAKVRGLAVVDGALTADVEGTPVTIPLYAMTEETAVVQAEAAAPARMTFSLEPRTSGWWSALRARLGARSTATGDEALDAAFTVRASDEAAMRQLLVSGAREALLAIDAWCSVTYQDGRITLRLDSPRLAGAHLLRAIEAAGAMARVRVATAAYR